MNAKLATILHELSVLYELRGVAFKPRAFEHASESVSALSEDVRDIFARDGIEGLEHIPGVGPGIAERIAEYVKTRHIREYDRMKTKLPVDITGLLEIEGIGPKTLLLLYRSLKIKTRAQLERAARTGKLAGVRGIGHKGEEHILRAIGYLKQSQGRYSPGLIWGSIRGIVDAVESWPHVRQVELCGSLRRMQETIGDLDLLVVSDDGEDTLRRFAAMRQVSTVYSHGRHRVLARLSMGIDADMTIIPAESFGSALIAWTGSKAHNIHLRTLAKRRGLLLDDYGLFRGSVRIAGRTERDVYRALGLQYIEPELRTDSGEIEAAKKKSLPSLIGYGAIRGDVQVQTDWTDGADSIETMAKAAAALGHRYIAITDHTKSLTVASGLDAKRIRKQWAEIDRVQKRLPGIRILKGTECDILKDGSLDLPDAVLSGLDVVGISVHSHFNMSEHDQTVRIIRAMEHPNAHILFHPTGRLIGRREPYAVDILKVIAAAKRTKTVLEINAHPARLDLKDEHVRLAAAEGVRFAINTDAHSADELAYLRWGIGTARRGGVQARQVVNTLDWREMLARLK